MRSYGETIDVRTGSTTGAGLGAAAPPEQFLWRGRLYLVRDVLAHWVELGAWWSAPGRPARPPGGPVGSGSSRGPRAGSGPATGDERVVPRSVAVDVGAVEREVWRVEAATGRSATPGVYDLVRDVPASTAVPRDGAVDADDLTAPGLRPGGHRPDAPSRWRLARALD